MKKKMRKSRHEESEVREPPVSRLSIETKKSVVTILLYGITILFLLASFGYAGPAGTTLYNGLNALFGWGYYLFPLIAALIGTSLLVSHEEKFAGITVLGTGAFIITGLGIIDIIFPDHGGFIGNIVGLLQKPFGYTASLIILACTAAAALLITLNAKILIKKHTNDVEEVGRITPKEETVVVRTPDGKKETMSLATKTEIPKESEQKEEKQKEKSKKEMNVGEQSVETNYSTPKAITGWTYTPINYTAPMLTLFKSSVEKPTSGDIRGNANIIKRTLESFGIHVEMGEINIGPKVTRYTLKPAEGIKLSRITALNQDMALALAAHPIRMEAPIPGKSLVGIEVPNKSAAIVRLGTMLAFQEFATTGPLNFILGRDVTGDPIYVDIEKLPHLLIAGATGSGKSVAIHSLILSLLYKNSPEYLRLILIDPKRVELSVYDGIPHLIAPVITEGKKAVGVFRWAISEMERRYEILLHAGVRDIKSYNKGNIPPLPYLIIVVDELADLMSTYGREVEASVVRLAQMARATGIHLVLSTQRPSVEVITGLIKANITARIALQVASQIDSRTILDMAGAEKLLGGGDMLFTSSEFSKPKRIQSAYVSEEEIHAVADFIIENNPINTENTEATAATLGKINQEGNIALKDTESENGPDMFDNVKGEDEDDLYEEAIEVVREAKKASASLLQRRLKVGYARAARLLDIMENKGIVGPGDGAKPREVYLNVETSVNVHTEPEPKENSDQKTEEP